ncbi:hypothetical protein D3C84_485100 [compost metagenome]
MIDGVDKPVEKRNVDVTQILSHGTLAQPHQGAREPTHPIFSAVVDGGANWI